MFLARKPFRYGNRMFMPGDEVSPKKDDVRMLQNQGRIGTPIRETTSVKPPEKAVQPEPEEIPFKDDIEIPKPKHLGGGWYQAGNQKIRGKDAAYELWHELFANTVELESR